MFFAPKSEKHLGNDFCQTFTFGLLSYSIDPKARRMIRPWTPHLGNCSISWLEWYVKMYNHKNYNFLDCDWFKKLLFSTNSLAKLLSESLLLDSLLSDSLLLDSLLSDSLLSDSSISQSHSKL